MQIDLLPRHRSLISASSQLLITARWIVAAIFCIWLIGCSPADDTVRNSVSDKAGAVSKAPEQESATEAPEAPVDAATDPRPTLADLHPYAPDDEAVIWAATEQLRAECMHDQGFDYSILPTPEFAKSKTVADQVDRFTPEQAAIYGYHPVTKSTPEIEANEAAYLEAGAANDQALRSNPAFGLALEGDDGTGGCKALSVSRLYGGRVSALDIWQNDFSGVVDQISVDLYDSPGVLSVQAEWSHCMRSRGYDFDFVGSPAADFDLVGEITDDEIAVATADANCRQEVDWYNTVKKLERDGVEQWINAHESAYQALLEAEKNDVASAQAVLADAN